MAPFRTRSYYVERPWSRRSIGDLLLSNYHIQVYLRGAWFAPNPTIPYINHRRWVLCAPNNGNINLSSTECIHNNDNHSCPMVQAPLRTWTASEEKNWGKTRSRKKKKRGKKKLDINMR